MRKPRGFLFLALIPMLVTATPLRADESPDRAEIPEVLDTRIVRVLEGRRPGESTLVLLSAYGRALRLEDGRTDPSTLATLREEAGGDRLWRLFLGEDGDYDVIDRMEISPEGAREGAPGEAPPPDAEPPHTRVPGWRAENPPASYRDLEPLLEPETLFSNLRSKGLRRGSQCFHRAYAWAYDLWRYEGVPTHKVFLFFTPKYLRQYGYKWWFHVSPYVIVDGDEVVLDATFTSGPMKMQEWTNVFLGPDPYCPTVTDYRGWDEHHRDKFCYLRKVPMHYYHPDRIEAADRADKLISTWDGIGLNNMNIARP